MSARLILETLVIALLCLAGAVVYTLWTGKDQTAAPSPAAARGLTLVDDQEHFLTQAKRQRRYLVHVPKGHDGKRPLPVVLGFHGGGGNAESFRTVSRLNAVADKHGFLVVYPDGTGRRPRVHTFNAGRCCGYAMEEQVDDVGFVRQVLDDLQKRYPIDARRVYATGMSNGAMLCYRLACEMPDRIAAIAPVAGTMAVDGPEPTRPVPVLHFHGKKDSYAPFAGGKGPLGGNAHRAVGETIAWWARVNRCGPDPAATKEGAEFTRHSYRPLDANGAPVVLVTFPEGGHTWPGGVDMTSHLGTGRVIASVDASAWMWEFFAKVQLPN